MGRERTTERRGNMWSDLLAEGQLGRRKNSWKHSREHKLGFYHHFD